ncbi:MAG: hypothetical protein R6X02_20690 [Enhygromyxa sp.]
MSRRQPDLIALALLGVIVASSGCFEDVGNDSGNGNAGTESGDGDGDGDGDTPGDGDGDTTGDGDTGDGDGDTGDGDGDGDGGDGDGDDGPCAAGDGVACDAGDLCSAPSGICSAGVCVCDCTTPLVLNVGDGDPWELNGPLEGAIYVKVGNSFQGPLSCGEDLFDLDAELPRPIFTVDQIPWEAELHRPCTAISNPMYTAFLAHDSATSIWARRALGLPDGSIEAEAGGSTVSFAIDEIELLGWTPNPGECTDTEVVSLRANVPWDQRLQLNITGYGSGRAAQARISRGLNSTDWFTTEQAVAPTLPSGSGDYTIDFRVPCGDPATDEVMNFAGLWSQVGSVNSAGAILRRITDDNLLSWTFNMYECTGAGTSMCDGGVRLASLACQAVQNG